LNGDSESLFGNASFAKEICPDFDDDDTSKEFREESKAIVIYMNYQKDERENDGPNAYITDEIFTDKFICKNTDAPEYSDVNKIMSNDELQADVIPKTAPADDNFTIAQIFAAAGCCDSPSEHVLDGVKWEAYVLKAHYASGIGRHTFSTDRTKEPTNDDTKKVMKHGWQHLHRAGNREHPAASSHRFKVRETRQHEGPI